MKEFYIFTSILIPLILVTVVFLNIAFKKSFIKLVITSIAIVCAVMGIGCYYIAIKGLYTMIFIAPIVIIFIVILLIMIKKQVSDPVKKLTNNIVDHFALGDLAFEFDNTLMAKQNEFGEISLALNSMKNNLTELISNIQNISFEVASASDEQRDNATQLSEGASEQAAAAEELSASVEEITANIHQNSENINTTATIYNKVSIGIIEVSKASELNTSSVKNIAEKISVINDIAFQTNILALNAAVEAARAGEYGKGFAVVASEVRKLAEKSKLSADEINDLAASNVNISTSSREMLEKMMPEIQKTTDLVNEVVSATQEQRSGVDQISNTTSQLNTIAQQNAAAAEEMASSAELLSEHSQKLQELSLGFKLK